jgi:hypothetical protein
MVGRPGAAWRKEFGRCLIAGWVAVRLNQASSRRHLLRWLIYPLFLVLCTVSYILHAVQNYPFIHVLPSMAFFALGLYLIYFRKPVTWPSGGCVIIRSFSAPSAICCPFSFFIANRCTMRSYVSGCLPFQRGTQ